MTKLGYIIIGSLSYTMISILICMKWAKYRIENRIEDLLIGDIIIYVVCFPLTVPYFIILGLIKIFNTRITTKRK